MVSDADCGAIGPGFESRKRLVEGEERWEAPDDPQGFLPLNWGGTEQNCTVICMVFKDFPEVINSIVVVKIPNSTDISLVWVPF
ncbi:hypothetical protein TNCV_3677281 [Trichonephila clavipes]|nr:hypothetical protein TNCV_3677281 [Trichonephila clavipes]